MKTSLTTADLRASVIAVPPLCRNNELKVDVEHNTRLIRHLEAGGINLFLYGGNANFYNISLSEYEAVLDVLEAAAGPNSVIVPSVGPYFGTMMDQAAILARRNFPNAMVLPTLAVSHPQGVKEAILRFVEKSGKPAVLYMKDPGYVTVSVAKSLVEAGAISWIKYAVVRPDPSDDPLLRELVQEVDPALIVSGIGEQPALIHVRDFGCGGFTSGCVCVAPRLSTDMLHAIANSDWDTAKHIQARFKPLEDLRNAHGPIPVLHHAVAASGIAETGPLLPLLAPLSSEMQATIAQTAHGLTA